VALDPLKAIVNASNVILKTDVDWIAEEFDRKMEVFLTQGTVQIFQERK
jgi:hypothetical protein